MNNKRIGIQLESSGDLLIQVKRDATTGLITNGLVVGDTLYQNQYIILMAQKGELKENPLLGIGIEGMTNDDDILSWKKLIREELAKDGMDVSNLTINQTTGELTLTADYQ